MTDRSTFFSCDWGTSSFRLRCVRREDFRVLGEVRTGDGAKVLHQRLAGEGRSEDVMERARAFGSVLERGLAGVLEQTGGLGRGASVMISGMASSTVGWRELPYASTPCDLEGSNLRVDAIGAIHVESSGEHPVWMASGVSTGTDMMRGEETELLGVMSLPGMVGHREGSLVVLPGTHSKHVRVERGAMVDFRTYMTGELMEVLSQHSLLRASVEWPPPGLGGENDLEAGVAEARGRGLARSLFQVRARSVLGRVEAGRNTWFLAGLVMGAEVQDLLAWDASRPIVLAGGVAFVEGYRRVFTALGAAERLTVVPPEQLVTATVRAHALLLDRVDIRGKGN